MNKEEQFTNETPLSIIIEKETPPEENYRQASLKSLEVIQQAIRFILQAENPKLASLGVGYALCLPEVCELSMRKRSIEIGVSHSTIQVYYANFKKIIENL